MNMNVSDWERETVKCPACQASLSVKIDYNIDVYVNSDSEEKSYANGEYKYSKEILGKYEPRIPNIGLFSGFFNAHVGDQKFMCNGHFVLKNIERLELNIDKSRGLGRSVDLHSVIDRTNCEHQEVFPDEMTSGLVRVTGTNFDCLVPRRCLDFIYAVFPDASLYSCGDFAGLLVKNGDDLCGMLMAMKMEEDGSNPWAQGGV